VKLQVFKILGFVSTLKLLLLLYVCPL